MGDNKKNIGRNYVIGSDGTSIIQDVGGVKDTLMFQADPIMKKHLAQDTIAAKYLDGTVFKYPLPAGSVNFKDNYKVKGPVELPDGTVRDSTTIGTAFIIPDTTHSKNIARISGQSLDVESVTTNLENGNKPMIFWWNNGLKNRTFNMIDYLPESVNVSSSIHNHNGIRYDADSIGYNFNPSKSDLKVADKMKKKFPNASNYIYSPIGNGAGTFVKYDNKGIIKIEK